MNKQNVLVGMILSFLINFAGWNYAVMPIRKVRLARQFQIAAERIKPARERAIIRYKLKRGIFKPRPSILSLRIWEWTYKIVIYSIAPGIFLVVLIRRRSFLSLPSGKPVLILTSLGFVSDLCSLWWITPATYFYLAAIAFVAKSEASSYPDPTSESLLSKARHWMDYRVEDLIKKNRRRLKR
jgi:hypothetical protein